MKKVILAALASTLIASSASADFYVSGHVGGDVGRFMDMPEVKSDMTELMLNRGTNIKGGAEVGYKVMDNLAVGVSGTMYFSPEYKSADKAMAKKESFLEAMGSKALATAFKEDGVETVESHKFSAMAAMLSARLDLVDLDAVQVYVSAGAGLSMLSEEMNVSIAKVDEVKAVAKAEADTTTTPPTAAVEAVKGKDEFPEAKATVKTATTYNPSFSFGAGVAFKLSDEFSVNLGAEYVNLGATSDKFDGDADKVKKETDKSGFSGKTTFSAFNAVLGVRFCF